MASWVVFVADVEVVRDVNSFRGVSAAMGSVCVMFEEVWTLAALA